MSKKLLNIIGVALIVLIGIFIIWYGYKIDKLLGTWFLLVGVYIVSLYLGRLYYKHRKKKDKSWEQEERFI